MNTVENPDWIAYKGKMIVARGKFERINNDNILLTSIYLKDGRFFRDHIWTEPRHFMKLRLKYGDTVEFKGRVKAYIKDGGTYDGEYLPMRYNFNIKGIRWARKL